MTNLHFFPFTNWVVADFLQPKELYTLIATFHIIPRTSLSKGFFFLEVVLNRQATT